MGVTGRPRPASSARLLVQGLQGFRPERVVGVRVGMMTVVMTVAVAVAVPEVRRRADADALDVMVMALLGQADLGLEAEDMIAVLAQLAVHVVLARTDLLDPLGEGVEHQGMVVEVGRLDELDLGMAFGDQVAPDSVTVASMRL